MSLKKLLLSAAIFAAMGSVCAAQIRNIEKAAGGFGQYFTNPQWSPDGRLLAMSGDNHGSIYVLDLQTGQSRMLVEAERSGFGFSWSADSQHILYRLSNRTDQIVEHAPAIVDVNNGQSRVIGASSIRMPALPVWSSDATLVYTTDGRDVKPSQSGVTLEASKVATTLPTVALMNQGSSLALIRADDIHRLNPMPGSEYVNASLSPDGTQVVFEVLGGGLYVLTIDTGAMVSLGLGNRPVWSPTGNRIAFMLAEDDGYTFTRSDIFLIHPDGTGRRKLSATSSLMEMNPSWSPDGTRIAFEVYATGDIYIITVDPS